MMSYNQAPFILDAILSVLNQEIPFDFELLIGDDASTDNTRGILDKEIIKSNPRIKVIARDKNIGLHKNYVDLVQRAEGKYIALLEADDYWIDQSKIYKQIVFLEQHPEMKWCFTDGKTINQNDDIISFVTFNGPEIFDLEYMLAHPFNPINNSIVFRKSSEPREYPRFFFEVVQWDTVLHYLRAKEGKIGHLKIEGTAWRRHDNATSFSETFAGENRYLSWITINKSILNHLPEHLHKYFNNYPAYARLSIYYYKNSVLKFLKYFSLAILNNPRPRLDHLRDLLWSLRNK